MQVRIMKDKRIKILSVPFASFTLPSLEISLLTGYLKFKGYNVEACYPGYLFADYLGWEDYKYLRDNIYGQKIFSLLLFNTELNHIEYNNKFEILLKKTEKFVLSYIKNLSLNKDELVIIYMYNKQFLASLFFAMKIKEIIGCKVWLGGFHCEGKLGKNIKELFPFIDDTLGIDIEESAISKLTSTNVNKNKNLDFLPTPDYEDFYKLQKRIKNSIPAFRKNNVCYQVEYARGCKWNKCTFCTLNCHSTMFRQRDVNLIINDYKAIADKYKTTLIYPEHFVMGDNWKEWILSVNDLHRESSNTINLNFKVKDLLDEKSFKLLKQSRANILIGTESFSKKHLERLNKGQSVIENVQVLKYATRWKVPCFHNLMYGLPYEDKEMYMENMLNMEYIYHLQPPFDIERFRLTYGSEIFNDYSKYNISKVFMKRDNQCLFPKSIKEKYIPFFYDFEVKVDSMIEEYKWMELIEKWRMSFYKNELNSTPVVEENLIKSCMRQTYQIIDKRYNTQIVYNLSKEEWEIYSYLDKIRSIEDVEKKYTNYCIDHIIKKFHKNKLVFIEDGFIVALAI